MNFFEPFTWYNSFLDVIIELSLKLKSCYLFCIIFYTPLFPLQGECLAVEKNDENLKDKVDNKDMTRSNRDKNRNNNITKESQGLPF